MSRDIYSSLSGAKAAWVQMESVANNLSNSNTTAFKEQRMTFKQVGASNKVLADAYVKADEVYYNRTDGGLKHTGVQSHLAIRGRGFFVGIELVADRATKEPFDPALQIFARVRDRGLENGLICYPTGGNVDGVRGDQVILSPPYVASRAEIDEIVDKFALTLGQVVDAL